MAAKRVGSELDDASIGTAHNVAESATGDSTATIAATVSAAAHTVIEPAPGDATATITVAVSAAAHTVIAPAAGHAAAPAAAARDGSVAVAAAERRPAPSGRRYRR